MNGNRYLNNGKSGNVQTKFSNIIVTIKKWLKSLNQKHNLILCFIYLIFLSLSFTFILKMMQYTSFSEFFKYMFVGRKALLLTFLFLLIISTGCFFITLSLKLTYTLVFIPIIIMSVINYNKFLYRQEVLVPSDFLQIREALNIVSDAVSINFLTLRYILLFIFIILTFILTFLIKKIKIKYSIRIIPIIALPIIVYYYVFSPNCLVNKMIPTHISENVVSVYYQKGFILGFFNEIPNMILKEPANYTATNVKKIYDNINIDNNSHLNDKNSKPNIIVILSEAFIDPLRLEGVKYSIDPLISIRKYMDEFGYLNMISPQVSGGTANVEYEVLTGVNTSLFHDSAIVYQQYINNEHFSIAHYLNSKGYVCLGIHPYYDWFWRRNKVYPHLGFNNFYSMETMNNTEKVGPFISDLSLSKEIIEKYEENKVVPLFIKGISMQNHMPYNLNRYNDDTKIVSIESDNLSSGLKKELTEYVNGLYYASEALDYLIEYFKKVEEPTYIIMYGDHGTYFVDYVDEYFSLLGHQPGAQTDHLLSQTPVIFWTNQKKEKIETDYIGASFLGKEILKYVGIELPNYFKVLDELHKRVKVLNRNYMIDSNNNFFYRGTYSNELNSLINNINLIGYDINFGKNYLEYNYSD